MSRNAVVIFTKFPATGRVKTRMLGALTARQACLLHNACLADAVALVNAFTASSFTAACEPWLYVGGTAAQARALGKALGLSKPWGVETQRGGDLGARMRKACAVRFRSGCAKIILIGTDTPWMGPRRLALALRALDHADVVLGPASDGGYYLVGARSTLPAKLLREIFRAIHWGTSSVLRSTVENIRRHKIPMRLLPRDFDLDRPSDLARAAKLLRSSPERSPALAKWMLEDRITQTGVTERARATSESSRRR